MALLNKNLSDYDGQIDFEPLPAGWYQARVDDSEMCEGPKGPYVKWTFVIPGKPNKIFDNMSMGNEISMKRLKSLAISCGHPNPNFIGNSEELHGKECFIRLKIEVDKSGQYDPKNAISAFKPFNGNGPTTLASPANTGSDPVDQGQAAPAQQQAPAEQPKMPGKNKCSSCETIKGLPGYDYPGNP